MDNFGKNLKICFFTPNSFKQYQHWYVTDGKWMMKFGKEDQIKEYLGRTKDGKVVTLNLVYTPGSTLGPTPGPTPGKLLGQTPKQTPGPTLW